MTAMSTNRRLKTGARARAIAPLLATTAFAAVIASNPSPSSAQVTTGGSVSPSPSSSPTWDVSGQLTVGLNNAFGTMTITNGSLVTSNYGIVIGENFRGSKIPSVVTVSGAGSAWIVSNTLGVGGGFGGTGVLNIEAGGLVSAETAVVGSFFDCVGIVNVRGAGSTLSLQSLTFGQLMDGSSGNVTVSDGGLVTIASGGAILINQGALNIGAAADQSAAAAGFVSGRVGLSTGELVFNHTTPGYVFASQIGGGGGGTIRVLAGETTLTADNAFFRGRTIVSGGVLTVDGQLTGTVSVLPGGRLRGVGTVETLAVQGTVAPGHSIGTLSVSGAYSQAAGSTYQAELNTAGLSDRIVVAGTATISNGAVLNVVKTDAGLYRPGVRYTVLTAAGGVTGTYTLTGDLDAGYFVRLAAAYDANNVYLDIVQSRTFASVGQTPNQVAVGAGADSLPATSPLVAALFVLPDGDSARAAFDSLSGSALVSTRAVIVEDSRIPRDAAINRLRTAFGDIGAPATSATAHEEGVVVWGDVFGGWGALDGNANASTLERNVDGVVFGVDAPAFDGWRLGVLAGYGHSKYKTRDGRYDGSNDDYHLGVYGGREWGPVALRTGASVTSHDQSARRGVAFPGFTDALEADAKGHTRQAFGELGYRVDVGGPAVAVEPFASLAYVALDTDAFTEQGGDAALSVAADKSEVTFTTLGVRTASRFELGGGAVTASGTLAWRRASGDIEPTARFAFAGGSSFIIAGAPIGKDAAVVELGLEARLSPAATFGLAYGAQFAGASTDQTVRGGLSVKF